MHAHIHGDEPHLLTWTSNSFGEESMWPVGDLYRGKWSSVTWVILIGWDREITSDPWAPWKAQHFPGSRTGEPYHETVRVKLGQTIKPEDHVFHALSPVEECFGGIEISWKTKRAPGWLCEDSQMDTTVESQTGWRMLSGHGTSLSTWYWWHSLLKAQARPYILTRTHSPFFFFFIWSNLLKDHISHTQE